MFAQRFAIPFELGQEIAVSISAVLHVR